MIDIKEMLQADSEKIFLGVYMIAILVFAKSLTPMLGQAWREGDSLTQLIFHTRFIVGLSLEVIAAALLGVFLGFLLLMTIDTKKRLQGGLLLVGTIVALVVLSGMGLLIPNIDSASNLPWLFLGLFGGIFLGGGRNVTSLLSGGVTEFRRASKAIYYFLTTIVVVGFLEYHLSYTLPISITPSGVVELNLSTFTPAIRIVGIPQEFVVNILLVGGFIATTRRFVRYDAEQDFFVLGPKASGKSLLLVGSYLEALERFSGDDQQVPLDPSQDLMDLVGELDRQQEGWFVDATRTQELEDLQFKYVHGSVFPLNVQLSSLDYAGELLEDLPDALLDSAASDSLPSTVQRTADAVEDADTLILLIDSNRFFADEKLDIGPYFEILQAIDDKEVILVATKADIFAEEFREERGLEAQQYFNEFKEFVNGELSANQTIQSLQAQSQGSEIHPVYYQTRTNENGERVPMRNSGSVATVGFDRLLNMLGEK